MTSLEVAALYASYGWSVLPIAYRSKKPIIDGWQNLRLTAADLPLLFNGKPQNVGVALGAASGGLVDVDLDCPQAVALGPQFLPPTRLRFGRPRQRGSHPL